MGHLFQVEWWEKHPSGCSFQLLWLKENGKGFGKKKITFLAHLSMKIMENKRKGGSKVTCCMSGGK